MSCGEIRKILIHFWLKKALYQEVIPLERCLCQQNYLFRPDIPVDGLYNS